jgi:hypothetical protein
VTVESTKYEVRSTKQRPTSYFVLRTCLLLILVLLLGGTGLAQRGYGRRAMIPVEPNAHYDGRFTFVRLRYGPPTQYVSQGIPWSHDYPAGERHFMKIMNEVSFLSPHTDEVNILGFDNPEIFKYPVSYMAEPGYLSLSDEEVAGFRAYLQKGGFVIFDDFAERRGGWGNFEAQMLRVLPGARFVDLDASHPIFHSFFEINDLAIIPQFYDFDVKPVFRGVFEDNDPAKRLLVMINFNTDISEFWEFSDTDIKPINESNEAYKLGVNYIIYGMTH